MLYEIALNTISVIKLELSDSFEYLKYQWNQNEGFEKCKTSLVFVPMFYFTWFRFVTYWFLLGAISSIGFGTGLHTGMLYLFPYVISYREYLGSNLLAGIIWGTGTAFGEIPPFLVAQRVSNMASLQNKGKDKVQDMEEMEEIEEI